MGKPQTPGQRPTAATITIAAAIATATAAAPAAIPTASIPASADDASATAKSCRRKATPHPGQRKGSVTQAGISRRYYFWLNAEHKEDEEHRYDPFSDSAISIGSAS
jgi:hypothetical protein